MHPMSEEDIILMLGGTVYKLPRHLVRHEYKNSNSVVETYDNPTIAPISLKGDNHFELEFKIADMMDCRDKLDDIATKLEFLRRLSVISSYISQPKNFKSKIPFTFLKLPAIASMLCAYMGRKHFFIGGIVESFDRHFNANTTEETWRLGFSILDMTAFRLASSSNNALSKTIFSSSSFLAPASSPISGSASSYNSSYNASNSNKLQTKSYQKILVYNSDYLQYNHKLHSLNSLEIHTSILISSSGPSFIKYDGKTFVFYYHQNKAKTYFFVNNYYLIELLADGSLYFGTLSM